MCFNFGKKSKKSKKKSKDDVEPELLSTYAVIDKLNNIDYRLEQKIGGLIMMEKALNVQTQQVRSQVYKLQEMQSQFQAALRLKQD